VSQSNGASHGQSPAADRMPPSYAMVEQVARELIRRAAAIEALGQSAPLANEWQAVFAAARSAVQAPAHEYAAIAGFGMRTLVDGRDLLAQLPAASRARAQTLAAAMVQLRTGNQFGVAVALASLVVGVSADQTICPLLPFFVCMEALVRCRLASDGGVLDAASFWRMAVAEATAPQHARLVIVAGLSGSGKSFVANGVAAVIGATAIASDVVRKRLMEVTPTERTPAERTAEVYSDEVTAAVYTSLLAAAAENLGAGRTVVVDATLLTASRRAPLLDLVRQLPAPAAILWCELSDDDVTSRLQIRAADGWTASDADARIRERQRRGVETPGDREAGVPVLKVDTGGDPARLFDRLLPRLQRARAEPRRDEPAG